MMKINKLYLRNLDKQLCLPLFLTSGNLFVTYFQFISIVKSFIKYLYFTHDSFIVLFVMFDLILDQWQSFIFSMHFYHKIIYNEFLQSNYLRCSSVV